MTLSRIVDVGVDASFEDILQWGLALVSQGSRSTRTHFEVIRFGMWLVQESRQMDVQEGRNVTEVEQTYVPEVDRFLVK